ncbi:MAG TPA: hypothetical protein VEK34_13880 [Methylocella sp.]|nr:hypothetical protein [Methylocella sp.]
MSETIESESLVGDSHEMKTTSTVLAEKVRRVTRNTDDLRNRTAAFAAVLDAIFDEILKSEAQNLAAQEDQA